MTEIIKLTVCLVIVFIEQKGSIKKLGATLYNIIFERKIDTLKVCVPSLLYVIQNNLAYLAVSHLNVVTYQVCTLMKSNCIHLIQSDLLIIDVFFVFDFFRSAYSLLLYQQHFLPLFFLTSVCCQPNGALCTS